MIACVSGVVRVMWQTVCGVVIAVGQKRERRGRIVAVLHFQRGPIDGLAVQARRRAGLEAAHGKTQSIERFPTGRCHSDRRLGRPGIFTSPIWMRPLQERTGGQHHGAGADRLARGCDDADNALVLKDQVLDCSGANFEIGLRGQRRLHGLAIELAVGLGARPAHRRALAPIEHPELDAGRIGDAPHHAVQRIDLADQMALADAADGGIAGHLADGLELVGEQQRPRAEPRRCGRRLAARMPSTDDDDVERSG